MDLPKVPRQPDDVSHLDVPKPFSQQAPLYQTPGRRSLFRWIEYYDQRFSSVIHGLHWNLLEFVILVPALIFSGVSVPVLLVLSIMILPTPLSNVLLFGTLLTFSVTMGLKKMFARIRPGMQVVAHRRFNVRGMEKNHAMPSGDSAQSAFWLTTISIFLGDYRLLTFIPFTMFGRVFFGCHWIADTIVGACVGFMMTYVTLMLMKYLGIRSLVSPF